MATLGLAVITNNLEATTGLIERYYSYFDELYITVADKDKSVYNAIRARQPEKNIKLSYFKWVDHFGKARLFNQSQIKTDYWLWMDDDDEITNPEYLRGIVEGMDKNHVDIMFMNYDYYQNEYGEQQANHWRERIIRTKSECKWENVPCHETVPAKGLADKTNLCSVRHTKPVEHMLVSMDRNQRLLEKDWQTNKDPRTAFYLGMTYAYHQQHDKAIKMYKFMIDNGGWNEQKVTALNLLADAYILKQQFDKAIEATDKAIELDPKHPDAYFHKIIIYTSQKQYAKAAEWADMALTKRVNEDSMQLIDPTKYTYRGYFLAAQANLFLGNTPRAFELYSQIAQTAPHYIQTVSHESGIDWPKTFIEGYNEHNAISAVKYLVDYLKPRGGNLQKLFEAIPPKLVYDNRLTAERQSVYPPKRWPDKSIVIYCGQGFEEWGPDYLEKGIGGSEEAVIYLSRELTNLGWNVTVFCERQTEYLGFTPWTQFNPYDEFNIYIAWRSPEFLGGIKARKKILDLHDTIPEENVLSIIDNIDVITVKSDYHKSLYPNIDNAKLRVITNGIYEKLSY